jgi:AcrR family transcriptional regulator
MAKVLQHSAAAQRQRTEWRGALRAVVASVADQLAGDCQAARLTLLEVFSAGPGARRRIGYAVTELERLVAGSFETATTPVPAPRHLVAGMTAGMVRVARTTTAAGRGEELPALADELAEWMLSLPDLEIVSLLRASGGKAGREPRPFPDMTAAAEGGTADERERLLRAAARLAAADGYAALTAPEVRSDAGVSRLRFDANFDDLEHCFLDAVETVADESVAQATSWAAEADDWSVRVSRSVLALCAKAARARPLARLAFLEILAPGRPGLQRRERLVGRAAAALCATAPEDCRPSPLTAEASVAAAWHIAQAEVAAGRARQLPAIAPLLSYVVLAPVVGPGSASAAIQTAGTISMVAC